MMKKKHFFTLPNSRELYMAGIYSVFGDETRYCVLTTAANESMARVHHRMPVVLTDSGVDSWLNSDGAYQRILTAAPPQLKSVCLDGQLS